MTVTSASALPVIVGHADHLANDGWDVHIVVGEPVPAGLFPSAHVHTVAMSGGASAADARALRRWVALLLQLTPDVVVAATPKASVLSLTAARIVGVRHRIWWAWTLQADTARNATARRAEVAAMRSASTCVAASSSLADAILAAGAKERPLVLGHGAIAGVDLDAFHPSDEATYQRPPTALFLGRLAAHEGLDYLTEVWPQVAESVPSARLVLAGHIDSRRPPGAALDFLLAQGNVRHLGHVTDVLPVVQRASVLVLPSPRQGMPAGLLEAAACEVPAVAWDIAGTRDAIDDQRTGYLVPHGDAAAFTDALVNLLGNPSLARNMGTAARELAAECFDRRTVEAHFAELLDGLVPLPGDSQAPAVADLRDRPGSLLRRVTSRR